MVEMDPKGINQLLLSPVFLLAQILGIIIPGALLMLLLGLKGNAMLRGVWLSSPFGYKTKVAIFLLLAYIFGSVLKLPLICIRSLRKETPPDVPAWLQKQTPEIRQMLVGVVGDGVLVSTPGLLDRLSIIQADAAFHFVTGTALLIASIIPGDGYLRWLEAIIGVFMCWAGIVKGLRYKNEIWSMIGIGWASILGRMSPQQFTIAIAVINSLKRADATPEAAVKTTPETLTDEKGGTT